MLRMAFDDVLTCIPHSDEGEKYCDAIKSVDILTLEECLKVFLMLTGKYLWKSLRKVWSLKGFASSFWILRSTGFC